MPADSLAVPLATDVVGRLEKRLLSSLSAWSESASALTLWEDEHLLENPSPELLQRHKATLEQLIRLGAIYHWRQITRIFQTAKRRR
jgi:hypothetical protein